VLVSGAVVGLLAALPVEAEAAVDVSAATGSSYAIRITGPITISARPTSSVTATAQNPKPAQLDQVLLNIPAEPVISSGTFRATGAAALASSLTSKLLRIGRAGSVAPQDHSAQGYAAVENLAALPGSILRADAVEAEALARCTDAGLVFSTATRVSDLKVAGTSLPQVVTPKPNQVLVNNPLLGLKVVLWETNWDAATGRTTDGSNTVFVNALHVTQSLLNIDLVASHAEATGSCVTAAASVPEQSVLPAVLPRTGGGIGYALAAGLLAAGALGALLGRRLLAPRRAS
jgi:hypothetical protein